MAQASTDPALAQSLFSQLQEASRLTDEDFAYLLQTAITSKAGAATVKTFLADPQVSPADRYGFYAYVNRQGHAPQRVDTALMRVGPVSVSPEDVLLVGGGAMAAAKGATKVGAMARGALGGAAPIVTYETARSGLQYVGVPAPLASLIAGVVAARTPKARAARAPRPVSASTPASPTRHSPAAAASVTSPAASPVTSPVTPAIRPIPAAPLSLTQEVQLTEALVANGFTRAQAAQTVHFMRQGLTAEEAVLKVQEGQTAAVELAQRLKTPRSVNVPRRTATRTKTHTVTYPEE